MKHWSEGKEIGNNWKIFLSIAVYKIFGKKFNDNLFNISREFYVFYLLFY